MKTDELKTGVSAGAFSRLRASAALPVVCLVAAVLPMVVICAVQLPLYPMTPDDQVQALYASGRFLNGGPSLLMPYSLVLVSAPLSLLYQVAPQVPWYPLLLMLLMVVSFAVAYTAAARSRLCNYLCAACLVLLLTFEVLSVFYFTYTIVAFLAISAGFMLLLEHAAFTRAGLRLGDVAGCLLVAVGYSLRPESGMAALAVFAPFAVWVLVRNRCASAILRGVAALACIALSIAAGHVAYSSTPGWETFEGYLDEGRKVLDNPELSTDAVRELAPELSENDVHMLYDWDFLDDEVFTSQVFENIGKVSSGYSVANLLDSLTAKTTYLLIGLALAVTVLAWGVVSNIGGGRDVRALALGVAAMLLVSYAIIIMRARPRLHVVIPLAAAAVFALMVCARAPKPEPRAAGKHMRPAASGDDAGRSAALTAPAAVGNRARGIAGVAFACVMALVVCGAFWWTQIRPLKARLTAPTAQAAVAYVEDHPDELIWFSHTQSLIFNTMDAFAFESWQFPENALFTGGWESHTAPWYRFLEEHDLPTGNPIMQLVERDDMVAVLQPHTAEYVETYLSEHTGGAVKAECVETLGPGVVDPSAEIAVYRFVRAD